MAKAFKQWTVLAHRPIEKLAENLWRVEGKMPDGRTQREMVVARRSNGELVIYNAIALHDAELRELEAFGTPTSLIVPSGFHRQDALIWKQRYPGMKVFCPHGATRRVSQVLEVDGDLDMVGSSDSVRFAHLDGVNKGEGVMQVVSNDGVTLVFNDVVLNLPAMKGIMGIVMGPTGRPAVPRAMRLMVVRDKRALAQHLERLADTPGLTRILVAHGAPIVSRAAETLRAVARELVGGATATQPAHAH